MSEQEYIPEQGQLCYTLTDYYDVFPIKNTIENANSRAYSER
jgi:hypothetical protein